ncbi:MAG: PqqD family protein [Lachnospiraceae bacterium]|nr:PqqD family protein [Lachnospiraceae bacterium]
MRQNKGFILREIANVPYLLPYGQMIADHKRGMKINSTGVYLWKLLEQEHTMNELLSLSAAYYEIPESDRTEFETDIKQFLNQLIAYGIVEDSTTTTQTSVDDEWLLSIGKLNLQLIGPSDAFPQKFADFVVTEVPQIHQTIRLHIGSPSILQNGQVLLRNQELVILEQEEQYILLFPQAKQLQEIHLKKDGSHATCYCLPPYTDTFHYDLFHALRLLYLYLAQRKSMVALHSASILYKNKAWLFSGRSGMGKSTHTNLWEKLYGTPIINGDLNLLGLENGTPVVYGIPWCGTSGMYDTKTYPLGGIVLLKQAPEDTVEELSSDRKQLLVCQRLISPAWSEELFDKNMCVVEKITEKVLICKLNCTKEDTAAKVIKERVDEFLD